MVGGGVPAPLPPLPLKPTHYFNSSYLFKCCGSESGIRLLFDAWIPEPESGSAIRQNAGSSTLDVKAVDLERIYGTYHH